MDRERDHSKGPTFDRFFKVVKGLVARQVSREERALFFNRIAFNNFVSKILERNRNPTSEEYEEAKTELPGVIRNVLVVREEGSSVVRLFRGFTNRAADAVVDFVHTILDEEPHWGTLLDNLHVTYGLKRHGIGGRLLTEAARELLHRCPADSRFYLWVLAQNTAIPFVLLNETAEKC